MNNNAGGMKRMRVEFTRSDNPIASDNTARRVIVTHNREGGKNCL